MNPHRGLRPDRTSPRRQEINDLGLPAVSDPGGFALAFAAVIRDRHVSAPRPLDSECWEETDDLGFPSEGDPADFACAFAAIRYQPIRVKPMNLSVFHSGAS